MDVDPMITSRSISPPRTVPIAPMMQWVPFWRTTAPTEQVIVKPSGWRITCERPISHWHLGHWGVPYPRHPSGWRKKICFVDVTTPNQG